MVDDDGVVIKDEDIGVGPVRKVENVLALEPPRQRVPPVASHTVLGIAGPFRLVFGDDNDGVLEKRFIFVRALDESYIHVRHGQPADHVSVGVVREQLVIDTDDFVLNLADWLLSQLACQKNFVLVLTDAIQH